MLILAIVLGGLMIYFLTPTEREISKNSQHTSFSTAFKDSFVRITLHRKAIFALLLLILTLIVIWWSHFQIELYNMTHGVRSPNDPSQQAAYYMTGSTIYAVIIYLLLIFRRTIRVLNSK